ncbi:hypothetical protein [Azotobacter chroococcum]|uniref:hypothetical protein n=1 Tax=Azotobacter chroococcum TaxID=353 RepID=UPI0010ADC248|nr:hypothetical protein [Azotobacter chroococcum]TKD30030.1 hypothetical protein FCG41_24450 [Azotobacter chroococcum]
MPDENPIVNYRMTASSALCVAKVKPWLTDAMEALNDGRPDDARLIIQELLGDPGIEELEHAAMSISH